MERNHYIHYTAADLLDDGPFLDSMRILRNKVKIFGQDWRKKTAILPKSYIWLEVF